MIFFFVWHKDALTELMVTSHIQVQQPEIEKKNTTDDDLTPPHDAI